MMDSRDLPLKEGYYIFYCSSNEDRGPELVARMLNQKIRDAEEDWNIEYISNAKIDADGGGHGKAMYFGFQCCILKRKKK